MKKCNQCGVELLGAAEICPLCLCVADGTSEENQRKTYPNAEKKRRRLSHALMIVLVAAILLEVLLIYILGYRRSRADLCIVLGVLLAYACVTLYIFTCKGAAYIVKATFLYLMAIGVVVAIDGMTGQNGWSVNYVYPFSLIALDLAIIIIMMARKKTWQSYILLQLLVVILAVVPLILYLFGFVTEQMPAAAAMFCAIGFFFVTLAVGGRRARNELYRRFHM